MLFGPPPPPCVEKERRLGNAIDGEQCLGQNFAGRFLQGEQSGHELQEARLIPRAGVNADKFLKHRLRTGVQLDRALEHSPSARIIANQASISGRVGGRPNRSK